MAEYISSFTTGFGSLVTKIVPSVLPGVNILAVYDGMIRYTYKGSPDNIKKIIFFNNSFFIIRFYKKNQINFDKMIFSVCSNKFHCLTNKGSFRIRFSNKNQFSKVDKRLSQKAEDAVIRNSLLVIDRLNPDTELWYVIRDEGFGFYGQLLQKRTVTEKTLNKGELRPELAYLMCCCCALRENQSVIDPFAGFGSIPIQISRHFGYNKLIVNDIDNEKVHILKKTLMKKNSPIKITSCDALNLTEIDDGSVDNIITDPPWGFYEAIDDISVFYQKMLAEFRRIIKPAGTVVVLSARKTEFTEAVERSNGFSIVAAIDTLVNGKKAAVYTLTPCAATH